LSKLLIAGGDSFVYGSGLSDHDSTRWEHSLKTWPALLAQELSRQYVCRAVPGHSNTAIARTVMLSCQQARAQDILVVVNWTFLSRFEFRFAYDPWSTPMPAEGAALYSQWHNFNKLDYARPGSHLQKSKQSVLKFIDDFYRHVGHDDIYEYYVTLKEIVLLQNFLKINRIPYIFSVAHNFFRKSLSDENIQCLLAQIDLDSWFFFPPLHGFVEWAKDYPHVEEHPSDLAHQDALVLVKEFFDEKIA